MLVSWKVSFFCVRWVFCWWRFICCWCWRWWGIWRLILIGCWFIFIGVWWLLMLVRMVCVCVIRCCWLVVMKWGVCVGVMCFVLYLRGYIFVGCRVREVVFMWYCSVSGCFLFLMFSFFIIIYKEWIYVFVCFSGGDSDNGSDVGVQGVGGYGLGVL